jgi:hypothetical protein
VDQNSSLTNFFKGIIANAEERVRANNMRLADLNNNLKQLGDEYRLNFDEYLQAEYQKWVLEENLAKADQSINNMENQMNEMTNYLNTVYVIIGSKKELTEKGVLETGGIMKSKGVNEDVDRMAFTPFDLRDLDEITLGVGKVKMMTEHPTDSYKIEKRGEDSVLIIQAPKEFWSLSKYLIIMIG